MSDSGEHRDHTTEGSVALVGAGPGDPELLTVKALRRLRAADVVVHDALVGDGVLDLIPEHVERIDVGKRPGRPTPQEMISALLVELARQGRDVIRLKGGDPFVFGRGGEEAITLVRAGIAVEVIPGITSSIAAPAAAGIPVTHRGVAASFTVVTGHRRSGEPDADWAALAQLAAAGGTIVILMGVARRHEIAASLTAGGLPSTTPVAAVYRASTGSEHTERFELGELGNAPLRSPSTIVIGAVAALDVTAPPVTGMILASSVGGIGPDHRGTALST